MHSIFLRKKRRKKNRLSTKIGTKTYILYSFGCIQSFRMPFNKNRVRVIRVFPYPSCLCRQYVQASQPAKPKTRNAPLKKNHKPLPRVPTRDLQDAAYGTAIDWTAEKDQQVLYTTVLRVYCETRCSTIW